MMRLPGFRLLASWLLELADQSAPGAIPRVRLGDEGLGSRGVLLGGGLPFEKLDRFSKSSEFHKRSPRREESTVRRLRVKFSLSSLEVNWEGAWRP